jgi:hypothetical protein
MAFFRRAPLIAGFLALLAVAGCSSGPSRQDAQAAAAKARTQVVSEARSLYLKMYNGHFAWQLGGMSGEYQSCPTSDRPSELAYYVFFGGLQSFSRHVDSAMYLQQAMSIIRAAGWKYTHQEAGNGVVDYFFTKDSMTLRVFLKESSKKIGDNSVVTVWGPCFDAGSAAQSLLNGSQHYPLPQPSPLPSSTPS